jgi:hypothetical protein
VKAGSLWCKGPVRLAHADSFLFVKSVDQTVAAYDLSGPDLFTAAPVWTCAVGDQYGGLAVVLQGRVLMATRNELHDLLPIDLRASKPADWKAGAPYDGRTPSFSKFGPMDMAEPTAVCSSRKWPVIRCACTIWR